MSKVEPIQQAKEQIAAQVKVLKLEPGDILVAKLGIADMGDESLPWIPTPTELESVRDDLSLIVPDNVKVLVAHMGLEFEIIHDLSEDNQVLVEQARKSRTGKEVLEEAIHKQQARAIVALQKFKDENGRLPTWEEWENPSTRPDYAPSTATMIKCFGTWEEVALRAAEL